MVTKSYTEARAHLAELFDLVAANREPVLITRRGAESVALIAADELDALLVTVRQLRSRTNAERLLTALARARAREGSPTTLAELTLDLGLDAAVRSVAAYPPTHGRGPARPVPGDRETGTAQTP